MRRPGQTVPTKRLSLADVTSKGKGLPSRLILHGVEGVGKSSFAAFAPLPIFMMARGETGLETLIDSGRLHDVPHFPEIGSWEDLIGGIETLIHEQHTYKTLVIDTLNGAERLCHESVCARLFNNDWGKQGFTSYQQGFEASLADWRQLLFLLDQLREQKRMAIICLCHSKVKTFKNPEGADFDRYAPDMHDKTWGLTHKWSDIVLFAKFETIVTGGSVPEGSVKAGKKGKGVGGQTRMMFSERHASYDAKNRNGLPEEIEMGDSGKAAWSNFLTALKSGKAVVANSEKTEAGKAVA